MNTIMPLDITLQKTKKKLKEFEENAIYKDLIQILDQLQVLYSINSYIILAYCRQAKIVETDLFADFSQDTIQICDHIKDFPLKENLEYLLHKA